jgi:hypothetical protein
VIVQAPDFKFLFPLLRSRGSDALSNHAAICELHHFQPHGCDKGRSRASGTSEKGSPYSLFGNGAEECVSDVCLQLD